MITSANQKQPLIAEKLLAHSRSGLLHMAS
jgi:hypothetical protein